jgi:hypothetical protein
LAYRIESKSCQEYYQSKGTQECQIFLNRFELTGAYYHARADLIDQYASSIMKIFNKKN